MHALTARARACYIRAHLSSIADTSAVKKSLQGRRRKGLVARPSSQGVSRHLRENSPRRQTGSGGGSGSSRSSLNPSCCIRASTLRCLCAYASSEIATPFVLIRVHHDVSDRIHRAICKNSSHASACDVCRSRVLCAQSRTHSAHLSKRGSEVSASVSAGSPSHATRSSLCAMTTHLGC